MSYWQYRVVRTTNESPNVDIEDEFNFSIREVYYNDKSEITAITENAAAPWGESIDDIKRSLERMTLACNKDVLISEDIVYGEW
jgi:hypothetical protein